MFLVYFHFERDVFKFTFKNHVISLHPDKKADHLT